MLKADLNAYGRLVFFFVSQPLVYKRFYAEHWCLWQFFIGKNWVHLFKAVTSVDWIIPCWIGGAKIGEKKQEGDLCLRTIYVIMLCKIFDRL